MLKLFPTPKIELKKTCLVIGILVTQSVATHQHMRGSQEISGVGGGVRVDGHLSLLRGVGVPRHIFGNVL